jgi:hypothetical protein
MLRSNSPKTPNIENVARPAGVVVDALLMQVQVHLLGV